MFYEFIAFVGCAKNNKNCRWVTGKDASSVDVWGVDDVQ